MSFFVLLNIRAVLSLSYDMSCCYSFVCLNLTRNVGRPGKFTMCGCNILTESISCASIDLGKCN